MNRKRLAEALAYVDEMRNRLLNQQPMMVPDEYGQRIGAAGEGAPSLRQVGQRTAQMGRQLISLDQPQDADAGQMAVDIAAGFTPLQYPQAARDFERARRESDPLGMGLATLAAVPVVGGVAKAANVARKGDVAAERAEALLTAQRNAAKPVTEGGLGLRPDNTPMERATAMGFEPAYHGTNADVRQIDMEKAGTMTKNPNAPLGFWMTPNTQEASRYANFYVDRPEGANVMPLMVRKGQKYPISYTKLNDIAMSVFKAPGKTPKERYEFGRQSAKQLRENLQGKKYDTAVMAEGKPTEEIIALDPATVRSRFAAFDPAKLTSPDLLAGVAGPTVLAAALMEQERRKKERKEKGL